MTIALLPLLTPREASAGEPGSRIAAVPINTEPPPAEVDPSDPYAKQAIREWLEDLTSGDAPTRVRAADRLGRWKVQQALRPLIARLQWDPEPSVRAAAAEALGKLGNPAAVDALIEAMRAKPLDVRSEMVAPAAARALGHIGDPAAVPALTHALKDAGELQFGAREALEMINSPSARAATSAQDERIATERIAALADLKPSTRVQACLDLQSLRVKSAAPALVKAITDSEPKVRAAAASALGATQDASPATTNALLAAVADSTADVRVAAAEALVVLPNTPAPATRPAGAVTALMTALSDKNARVRAAAASVLGKWRCAEAASSLARVVENPAERVEVRMAACAALGRLDDPAAAQGLSNALSASLPAVREEAALQLARRGDGRGVDALMSLVRNGKADENRRVEAIKALAKLGDDRADSALVMATRDRASAAVGNAARAALTELRTTAATRPAP